MDGNTVRQGDMIVFLKSCIIPKGRISALHVRTVVYEVCLQL